MQKALNFLAREATGPGLPAIPAETMRPGQRCRSAAPLELGAGRGWGSLARVNPGRSTTFASRLQPYAYRDCDC